jgi:hypothetical protein
MSSKKASFGSKDPSHVSGNTPQVGGGTSSEKTSYDTRDPFKGSDDSLDTSIEIDDQAEEKPSFYLKDPEQIDSEHAISDSSNPSKKKYMGVEQRRGNRRKTKDRRGDVRFDLEKSDRRQNEGRREEDAKINYW